MLPTPMPWPVSPALLQLGAAHRTDTERVPLLRARGRVLAEGVMDGSACIPMGRRLSAADLGVLAAAGRADVLCARRPMVAVFTAGDALRPPGQALGEGERYDDCRAMLMALLTEAGLEPVAWPVLPGDPARAASTLADAAQAFDLIVSCSASGSDGWPRLAKLFDATGARLPLSCPLPTTAPSGIAPIAVLGMLGTRSPAALWLALPDDRAAIIAGWQATAGALIDAMQGLALAENALEIDAADWPAWRDAGARLIDLREPEEHSLGLPIGAEAQPLSTWTDPHHGLGDTRRPIVLLCASGVRSLRTARSLREQGIAAVHSLRGGMSGWRAAGLPLTLPTPSAATVALDAQAMDRYDRHLRLAAVGAAGQNRLLAARVVIIGAGGLGSPAAFYLAAAGVGQLVLVDDDCVERSNLQRQIVHTDRDVGRAKVVSARERLLALNPDVQVDAIEARVQAGNVESLLRGASLVIDGSDNFTTRYVVDAACLRLGLPLVYGAVERFTGQVSVFDAGRRRGDAPCYRCLFPEPPGADAAPNCAEAGVLGVLPGLVGLLQATEALKLLLGLGESLVGRLLTFDALAMNFRELALPVDPACPGCGPEPRALDEASLAPHCAAP